MEGWKEGKKEGKKGGWMRYLVVPIDDEEVAQAHGAEQSVDLLQRATEV